MRADWLLADEEDALVLRQVRLFEALYNAAKVPAALSMLDKHIARLEAAAQEGRWSGLQASTAITVAAHR